MIGNVELPARNYFHLKGVKIIVINPDITGGIFSLGIAAFLCNIKNPAGPAAQNPLRGRCLAYFRITKKFGLEAVDFTNVS